MEYLFSVLGKRVGGRGAILKGFGNVHGFDDAGIVEIGDGTGYFDNFVV